MENRFNRDGVFSKKVRAGRRRTYFFDVRTTRSNDYYITITESKKRYDDDGYERHKLHLYKEDFHKFIEGLQDTVDHVKTELLPEYDFDEYDHKADKYESNYNGGNNNDGYNENPEEETTSEEEVADEIDSHENDDNEVEADEDDLKWD
ncbi:MAG: DUF3276 family protein [Chitinophagales bacterium]